MSKWVQCVLLGPVLLTLPWLLCGRASDAPRDAGPAGIRVRRPIALALADGGKRLLVANRDSGTVAVLEAPGLRRVAEARFGRKLADMAATPDGGLLLLADEMAGDVVLVTHRQGVLRELRRLQVGLGPVGVCLSEDGRHGAAACLWPRRLVVLDLAANDKGPGADTAVLDLPFAPRRVLLVPGTTKVVVADAFAGGLAVVDVKSQRLESVRHLPGHNISGLAVDRQRQTLWLTHQHLNPWGRTTPGDIRNGSLIDNDLRQLPLARLLHPSADALQESRLYPLGDVERGAGDPTAVAETADGSLVVALAGTNELAVGRPAAALWTRLPVGQRPTALAVDAAGRWAYVANTFADSISVVDCRVPRVVATVRLGPAADLRPEERGELLFYDARLSLESWFSCHSCHPDGHTNGGLNDNFTDGSFGTPKRVLSLLGVKDTGPWAWSGQMPDLEAQVRTSLRSTLQGPAPSAEQVRDLTAYLRTLSPPPSLVKARGRMDAAAWKRGRHIFVREKCGTCHTPPTYTSSGTYDVGLRDELGRKRFNPPSLRGLSQGGPYFHDNRARSLDEVFTRYHHELPGKLSEPELADLLHFLGCL